MIGRRVALFPVARGALPYAWPPSPACKASGSQPKSWPSAPIGDALLRRHPVDTWFQTVTGFRGHWPRVAKPILLQPGRLAALGLGLGLVGVDLDRPDHGTNPWARVEDAELAVMQAVSALDGDAAVYATRGGLRVLWVLDPPVPLDRAQSFINQLHADYLPRFGLPVSVDSGVVDWTRGYRTPWCPRADEKTVPWGEDRPPMDLAALFFGRSLSWRPAELRTERPREMATFDWSGRKPATGNLHDRVRQIVDRWAAEIAASGSRHEVLLRKTRALGGLAVGHGFSPEPYVATLISAASDSGDARRTSGDGLANGARQPWKMLRSAETVGNQRRAFGEADAVTTADHGLAIGALDPWKLKLPSRFHAGHARLRRAYAAMS